MSSVKRDGKFHKCPALSLQGIIPVSHHASPNLRYCQGLANYARHSCI